MPCGSGARFQHRFSAGRHTGGVTKLLSVAVLAALAAIALRSVRIGRELRDRWQEVIPVPVPNTSGPRART
jgi:hypothetical protein